MTIYNYNGIEFSDRYVELFTAVTKLCDYASNTPVDFLNPSLNILYELALSSKSDDYSLQIIYLRNQVGVTRFIPDETIVKFFLALKQARKNHTP